MKPSLELRVGQKLTMTPQLQQAIRLLQLSTLELRQEIQQAVESNMMLEMHDEGAAEPADPASEAQAVEDGADRPEQLDGVGDGDLEPGSYAYEGITAGGDGGADQDRGRPGGESLHEHLLWQLEMTALNGTDRAIAAALIDAVDTQGYLGEPLEHIHAVLARDLPVELDEVEAVLHRVQGFDPVVVGARDLGEALGRQLAELPGDTPGRALARQLVRGHIAELAGGDLAALARKLEVDETEIRSALELIRTLNPRPGAAFDSGAPDYVIPDVIVRRDGPGWRVDLNPDVAPRLGINRRYAALARHAASRQDADVLKQHLQEARWFIRSLESRNQTLKRVAESIVHQQGGFLEHGAEAMRPLVLRDVAEEIGMHESTVSRVTTQKFMLTPRGIFEFKYFFSSHVATSDGGECSATAIHAMIRRLIAEEDPRRPLSDSRLATVLSERGINVARRTVAKYREAMSIPSSSDRRRVV